MTNLRSIRVSYFERKPFPWQMSIERVFSTIISCLPTQIAWTRIRCPYERGAWGRFRNLLFCRRHQGHINHITGDVHYLALGMRRQTTILTIHDCRKLSTMQGLRKEVMRLVWYEWPIRRAAVVTTISERTKGELLQYTSCPPGKIRVIPNPLPTGFGRRDRVFNAEVPVLLQMGTAANKNLERVIRAISGLKCRLDIVGRLTGEQINLLNSHGIDYSAASEISDTEVLTKYENADIVLFCSDYEGFGMPIIEANAIGRPVVASNIDPLITVAGGAACLIDPADENSIRTGIDKVIKDVEFRVSIVERGFQNAARYSAEDVAAMYSDLYRELAGCQSDETEPVCVFDHR